MAALACRPWRRRPCITWRWQGNGRAGNAGQRVSGAASDLVHAERCALPRFGGRQLRRPRGNTCLIMCASPWMCGRSAGKSGGASAKIFGLAVQSSAAKVTGRGRGGGGRRSRGRGGGGARDVSVVERQPASPHTEATCSQGARLFLRTSAAPLPRPFGQSAVVACMFLSGLATRSVGGLWKANNRMGVWHVLVLRCRATNATAPLRFRLGNGRTTNSRAPWCVAATAIFEQGKHSKK